MKIAILQASFPFTTPKRNAARLLDLARDAGEKGADLCIAPELALSGVLPRDLLLNHHFAHDCRLALQWLAEELGASGPAVLAGSPMLSCPRGGPTDLICRSLEAGDGDALLNCAVLIEQGEMTIVAAQKYLPVISAHDYTRYFTAGWGSRPFMFRGLCFAAVLGCDTLAQPLQGEEATNERALWSMKLNTQPNLTPETLSPPENSLDHVEDVSTPGALLCLAAVPFSGQGGYLFTRGLAEFAGKFDLPVIFANAASAAEGLIFGGGSALFSRTGVIQAKAGQFSEEIFWLKAEKEQGLAPLPGMSVETGRIAVRPLDDAPGPAFKSKEEITFAALQWGLKCYFKDSGFTRVFLGLSGGLDSALCAVIAAAALGPQAVCGVLMPSPHTSQESLDLALSLADNLGIATQTFPIVPLMNGFDSALEEAFEGRGRDVTEENLQARIRGTLLMALSNKLGGMVICPGNKSELSVGYSTLYGDSVGALALIGDVYKSDIYDLAVWCNAQGREVIPEGIITRPPTAELSPGQCDADVLPPYPVLDAILRQYIEEGRSAGEIRVKGADEKLVAQVIRMVRCAEFKRRQAPPVVAVSARPFGSIRRMPLLAE